MCDGRRHAPLCPLAQLVQTKNKQCISAITYLYLILDDVGLSKQMLLNAPLCTIIETILEIVY